MLKYSQESFEGPNNLDTKENSCWQWATVAISCWFQELQVVHSNPPPPQKRKKKEKKTKKPPSACESAKPSKHGATLTTQSPTFPGPCWKRSSRAWSWWRHQLLERACFEHVPASAVLSAGLFGIWSPWTLKQERYFKRDECVKI